MSTVEAAAGAAQTLSARREEIARDWAGLPLFTTVYGGQQDEAFAAAIRLVEAMVELAGSGRADDVQAPSFAMVRDVLSRITSDRLRSGGDLQQVMDEIGQLWIPLTEMFDSHPGAATVPAELLAVTELIGSLRVAAVVVLLSESDEVVARQRQELMEISTPVIRLWEGIVAVPLIGTLDSIRSQVVMESLLNGIVDEQAAVAILDITGVPMVDTLVAQHLMKTAMAVQLMGAECVISGIRPQIAQTIVHLGIDLREITTRATLSDALKYGLARTGVTLGPAADVDRIPILRLGSVLIVSVQGDLADAVAVALRHDVGAAVSSGGITGVILDVSGVAIVDSYLGRVLTEIAADCSLLGASTVVAGIKPAVAITLVEMGLRLDGARTARSLEAAVAMLGADVAPTAILGSGP